MTDITLFPLQLIRTGGLSQFAAVAAQPDSTDASGRKPGEPQFLAAKLPDQLTILEPVPKDHFLPHT